MLLLLRPKAGCYILSLVIPNKEIVRLEHNGKLVKSAYLNNKKVYTHCHRVRFFNHLGKLLETQYVETGKSAYAPVSSYKITDFHFYYVKKWDKDFSNITEDIDVTAVDAKLRLYYFRHKYGMNPELYGTTGSTCTVYDGSMSYTSIAKGTYTTEKITCTHTGATNSSNAAFRSMKYLASLPIDLSRLAEEGYTALRATGIYTNEAGTSYGTTNLRGGFITLQTSSKISTTTADGVIGSYQKEIFYNNSSSSSTSVAANIGTLRANITLPTTGNYYLIVGSYSKGFRESAVTATFDNIWFE